MVGAGWRSFNYAGGVVGVVFQAVGVGGGLELLVHGMSAAFEKVNDNRNEEHSASER